MPYMEEMPLRDLSQPLENELADDAELPKHTLVIEVAYFFPVFSRLGFICVHLSRENRYSILCES